MSIEFYDWCQNFKPKKLLNLFEYFFSEDQSRYILEVKNDIGKVKQILEDEKYIP